MIQRTESTFSAKNMRRFLPCILVNARARAPPSREARLATGTRLSRHACYAIAC
jgi:hypothetical protein